MKKLMIMALAAALAVNISAQETKERKADKECRMTPEQRTELDIKYLTEELYLSDEQAAKFAVTYREYVAAKAKLNETFKTKFAKDLNERQVKAVLHYHGPKFKDGKPKDLKDAGKHNLKVREGKSGHGHGELGKKEQKKDTSSSK